MLRQGGAQPVEVTLEELVLARFLGLGLHVHHPLPFTPEHKDRT
jgi:hypothetical protein